MSDSSPSGPRKTALHLTVNNHPGVMSHVCGLFARRAFNLEGILVTPASEGAPCHVWLLVNEDRRMPQILSQVRKLQDVLEATTAQCHAESFSRLASYMPKEPGAQTPSEDCLQTACAG